MSVTDDLAADLDRDERLRLKPYLDTKGKVTIGWGRNLTDVGIRLDEAQLMRQNDMTTALVGIRTALPWFDALDTVRQRVLLNMGVNLGVQGLLGFSRMLAAMQRGDYETAAEEMLASDWSTDVGGRATRLATWMRTGEATI